MQLIENQVVAGRFRLNRMIGRGGMGSVWHATHLGLDIPCAVKFIEGEMASHPEAQARFEREAKAAAQLRSPHVVQILDHGVCEGRPYIAMELLDGEDLGKRLGNALIMGAPELHAIVSQVCRALTKAHAAGIVHRDLKPDNIFLVPDEDDRKIAKVLDFGIAKSRSGELAGNSNTKTGAMLGTPYYMSPEQAQGTKQVDSRSDLWALAVICFRALTGRLPFESEALGDLLMKIIIAPIPVPSQFAPSVPAGFDRWWFRAAAREPSERFQTAKEFSDSLALACGLSQVSGVIDRSNMRPVVRSTPDAAALGATAEASTFRDASPPAMTGGAPGPGLVAGAATGAPTAHTFAQGVPSLPGKTNRGVIAAVVGVAAALALTGGGVVIWKMASKSVTESQSVVPSASVAQQTSPPSSAAAVAPTPPEPLPVVQPRVPSTADSVAAPSPALAESVSSAQVAKAPHEPRVAKPPAAATPKPKAKDAVGF